MKLTKAAEVIGAAPPKKNAEFQSVSIDTRTLSPGDLFIAIRGPNFDGHDFVKEAEEKAAVTAIVSESVSTNMPLLVVPDTRKALADLAAYHRSTLQPTIIAVTGSCGKTTVKNMLAQICQQAGSTLATEANFNNYIGVPKTLLRLTHEHHFAIV